MTKFFGKGEKFGLRSSQDGDGKMNLTMKKQSKNEQILIRNILAKLKNPMCAKKKYI